MKTCSLALVLMCGGFMCPDITSGDTQEKQSVSKKDTTEEENKTERVEPRSGDWKNKPPDYTNDPRM